MILFIFFQLNRSLLHFDYAEFNDDIPQQTRYRTLRSICAPYEKLEKVKDKLFGLDDVERKKNFICIMSSTDTY